MSSVTLIRKLLISDFNETDCGRDVTVVYGVARWCRYRGRPKQDKGFFLAGEGVTIVRMKLRTGGPRLWATLVARRLLIILSGSYKCKGLS